MKIFINKNFYLILFFILLFISFFLGKVSFAKKDSKCLICHKVKREPKVLESGEKLSLYVNPKKYKASVHGNIDCIFCHLEIKPDHPKPIKIKSKKEYITQLTKNCLKCHPPILISKSPSHAKVIKRKDVTCVDCHGSHYIKPLKEWKKTVSVSNYCLMCHSFRMVKTLSSGERLLLKINKKEIRSSVHGELKCINCHNNFSKTKHPLYNYKNKKTYAIKLSKKICQRCHTDEKLRKNPAHYTLSKTAPCIQCHGYHNVKPAKLVKVSENKYCLNCHSRRIVKKMQNGEILSLKVDEAQILQSVHKNLRCSNCHKGFSIKKHPIRSFKSIADYRNKAQEICNNCHSKETKEYTKSIHALAVLKGNKKAPDCLRCHGYHTVMKITSNTILKYKLCISCHNEEDKSFKESIHYKAFKEGKQNAPVCSSCHKAHKVLPTNIANLKDSCLDCHKNAKKSHNKWLYNPPFKIESFVDVHFDGASCSACHVSGAKAIILTLINSENKPLTIEKIANFTNWDIEEVKIKLDSNNDNIVQQTELWQFLKSLKENIEVKLKGKLDIVNPNDAHKIISKKGAIKDCAFCHNPETPFVRKLEINKEGEKGERIDLEKNAVNSVYAIPNISDFYVLGLTKISILDTLFVIALIAGAGVAAGHILLRIITTPIRRKRKEGK